MACVVCVCVCVSPTPILTLGGAIGDFKVKPQKRLIY